MTPCPFCTAVVPDPVRYHSCPHERLCFHGQWGTVPGPNLPPGMYGTCFPCTMLWRAENGWPQQPVRYEAPKRPPQPPESETDGLLAPRRARSKKGKKPRRSVTDVTKLSLF